MTPGLTTERMSLRPHELADYPAFRAFWMSDRTVHIGGPLTHDYAVWRQFTAERGHWVLCGFGLWTLLAGDKVLGWVGLQHPTHYEVPELAWHLTAEAEGQGLAFEAAQAALADGRARHGVGRAISYVAEGSLRSHRLAERLGAHVAERGAFEGAAYTLYEHRVAA